MLLLRLSFLRALQTPPTDSLGQGLVGGGAEGKIQRSLHFLRHWGNRVITSQSGGGSAHPRPGGHSGGSSGTESEPPYPLPGVAGLQAVSSIPWLVDASPALHVTVTVHSAACGSCPNPLEAHQQCRVRTHPVLCDLIQLVLSAVTPFWSHSGSWG